MEEIKIMHLPDQMNLEEHAAMQPEIMTRYAFHRETDE